MESEILQANCSHENESEVGEVDIISDPADVLVSNVNTSQGKGHDGNKDLNSLDKCLEAVEYTRRESFSETRAEDQGDVNLVPKINKAEGNEFSATNDENELSDISCCLQKVEFDSLDEGVPSENDIYNRFYFESDHLALKDNPE